MPSFLSAGRLVCLGGIAVDLVAVAQWSTGARWLAPLPLLTPLGLAATDVGLGLIATGVALLRWPKYGRPLGAAAIVLAVASLPVALGGLAVGFVLAILGAGRALGTERPPPAPPPDGLPRGALRRR